MKKTNIVDMLEQAWPKLLVYRRDCVKASSGAITRKYLANLDSQGKGPDGKVILNGKACYPSSQFFEWLRRRVKE